MLRKIRAALIITAVWVLCWVPVALALERILVHFLVREPYIDSPYMGVGVWATWGALSGFGFSLVLGVQERGRAVGGLSTWRVVSWGAIGSALVPLVYMAIAFIASPPPRGVASFFWLVSPLTVGLSALLGVICTVFTLALMRQSRSAEPVDRAGLPN